MIHDNLGPSLKGCNILTLGELEARTVDPRGLVLFLLEVESVFLGGISEPDYLLLRSALLKSGSILWATKLGHQVPGVTEPRHALADGLGRALMSEYLSKRFVTVSLGDYHCDSDHPKQVAELLSALAIQVIDASVENTETKCVAGSDKTLCIGRVYGNTPMDTMVSHAILPY